MAVSTVHPAATEFHAAQPRLNCTGLRWLMGHPAVVRVACGDCAWLCSSGSTRRSGSYTQAGIRSSASHEDPAQRCRDIAKFTKHSMKWLTSERGLLEAEKRLIMSYVAQR
jgi:hypothetical protein